MFSEESFEFVRKLQDQKTDKIPDTVTFECELSLTGLEVTWLKADRVIKPGEKYSIEVAGCTHRLIISDVDGRDQGEYSAVCKHKSTEARLSVEG